MIKRLVFVTLMLAGCAPTTYSFTPASAKGVVEGPANCNLDVMASEPQKNYEEVGTLDYYNGKEPTNLDDFKKAVKKQACEAGGDAVIAIANAKGQFTQGRVIHYLGDMATPIKPISDMPAPQQTDTDTPLQ
jgi:hypothetical protein